MRTHQNTLLAMKLSTALMSLSAVVLVVLLLTSSALARYHTEDQKPQTVIQAPLQPASRASMPVVSRTVYIYMVTATPDPQTVTAPLAVAEGQSATKNK